LIAGTAKGIPVQKLLFLCRITSKFAAF
jgi:hypothetical protein